MTEPTPRRLLYLTAEDWAFLSHRLPMAEAALEAGFDVAVACRTGPAAAEIERRGFRLFPLAHLRRESRNPWRELRAIVEILRLYRRYRPDIVHHVALKPVLYGGLAAHIARVPAQIAALIGMGAVFIGTDVRARLLRALITVCFRAVFRGQDTRLLVQNRDDLSLFADRGLIDPTRIHIVPGSGVDTETLVPTPEPAAPPVHVALAARLLYDKGIVEAVEAIRLCRNEGHDVHLRIAGGPDPANPRSIGEAEIARLGATDGVRFLGHRDDVADIYRTSHIAILPSYREGLPKALLEAAALGRAIIATDVPGCRELVETETTGLLVPVRDARALANALQRLAEDAGLRRHLAENARTSVEGRFSARAVKTEIVALYRSLLPPP